MDWFFKLLDFVFMAGEFSACLCLAYGGYLSMRYGYRHPALPAGNNAQPAFGSRVSFHP